MPQSGEELLREFTSNRDILAARISSSDLGGLFVKQLTVPHNAAALAFAPNGETTLYSAGQGISGKFEVVLAKTGEIHVALGFLGLRALDRYPVDARASFALRIDSRGLESFKAFARFSGGLYRMKDLEAFVVDRSRAALSHVASSRAAADLHRKDLLAEIERAVADRLQSHLLGTGILFDRLLTGGFVSSAYEKQADQASTADREARDRERRLKEIGDFLQKEESLQKLLAEIDDPRLKLIVYKELIEGGARKGADDWLKLDEGGLRKVHGLMQKLLGGSQMEWDQVLSETAEKAFVAIGTKAVEVETAPPYGLNPHEIGEPVRSVRPAAVSGRDLLLIGAKKTCILLDPVKGERFPFPLPGAAPPVGGINSVDSYGNCLYATHSEFGLALWDLNRPGRPAELIFQSLTSGNRTSRAVRVLNDRLLFASGPSVFLLDLGTPSSEPLKFSGSHGAVTSVAMAGNTLFAATGEGVVLSWDIRKPDYPEVVLRKDREIKTLRLAKGTRGLVHLLYAFNDTAIHARVIGQPLETDYEALGNTFAEFDASSDLVVAPGHRSRRLFFWSADQPRRPEHVADLSPIGGAEIMDVSLRKRLVLK